MKGATYILNLFLISTWILVIHGGIDGFTRIPVYLKCNTNNWAETVLDAFLKATQQ